MSNDNRTVSVPVSLLDRIVTAISEVPNARIPATSTVRELTAVVREIWELRRAAPKETKVVVSVTQPPASLKEATEWIKANLMPAQQRIVDGEKPWPVVSERSSNEELLAAAKWWGGKRVLYRLGDVRTVTSIALTVDSFRGRAVLSHDGEGLMPDDEHRLWQSIGVPRRYGFNVPIWELGTKYPLVSEDVK